jgi:DNA-binding TFAR19-related protein (PDSD5 family)
LSDEDLTLKLLRLRKMRQRLNELAKQREATEAATEKAQTDPVEELKKNVEGRGEEVIDAALTENPELVRRVAAALVKAIREGRVETPIDSGDLLALFRRLGLNVKVETRLMVQKRGETKDLRKALEEDWQSF